MERARPFSKAHCRPPRRRPKAKIFTGRLCRSGRLPLFCKSIRCAATVKAVQRALVFFSPLPPQRTRVGTAFPPGGRKQFRLGRYTVRNRRQKTGVLGPSQRQRHWQAKGRAVLQRKIPLYSKLDFTKGSADLRKNTRLLLADFSKAGTVLRKKCLPATDRLAGGQAQPCWKIFALHQGPLCRKAEGGASPALLSRPLAHFLPQSIFCLPRQVKASSALLSMLPSRRAAAALLSPPRPRSSGCRKERPRKP